MNTNGSTDTRSPFAEIRVERGFGRTVSLHSLQLLILPNPVSEPAIALARLVGKEAAFGLIERFGGVRIFVPTTDKRSKNNSIRVLFGDEVFFKLVSAFEGLSYVKIPLGREWRCIVYRTNGFSCDLISLILGIERTSVHRILNEWFLVNEGNPIRRNQIAKSGELNGTKEPRQNWRLENQECQIGGLKSEGDGDDA